MSHRRILPVSRRRDPCNFRLRCHKPLYAPTPPRESPLSLSLLVSICQIRKEGRREERRRKFPGMGRRHGGGGGGQWKEGKWLKLVLIKNIISSPCALTNLCWIAILTFEASSPIQWYSLLSIWLKVQLSRIWEKIGFLPSFAAAHGAYESSCFTLTWHDQCKKKYYAGMKKKS